MKCTIEGCENGARAKGYCGKHYANWWRCGNPVGSLRDLKICSVVECGKRVTSKGFCSKHYQQFKKHGDPLYRENRKKLKVCSAVGCGRQVYARGFCDRHYQKFRKHGDPEFTARSPRGTANRHPLYRLWAGMRQRCTNPRCESYPNYGGRGISICPEWDDFWRFVDDVGERPSSKHSIDRINSSGNYEPSNVRWATPKEQSWNRRNTQLPERHREIIESALDGDGIPNKRRFCSQNGINYSAALRFMAGQNYAPEIEDFSVTAPAIQPTPELLAPLPPLPGICSIPGCGDVRYGKGLCRLHYRRQHESSSLAGQQVDTKRFCRNCEKQLPDHFRPQTLYCDRACTMQFQRREGCYTQEAQLASRGACSIEGCGKPKHAQDMCRTHYMKKWHAEQKTKERPG